MLLAVVLAIGAATTSFDVDGVKVVLRNNPANNVVAANLYLLGGPQLAGEKAGIEPVLLDISERGTLHYPKAVLRRKMANLGSEIVVRPTVEWTMFGIRTSSEVFDSTWSIFADRVMNPTLAASEVEIVKAQYRLALTQQNDDPDALASRLADSVAFAGHPYAMPLAGTVESLAGIDAAGLKAFHKAQFVKSRMMLVVVGNVDSAHVARLVRATLSRLPAGSYRWEPAAVLPSSGPSVVIAQRPLPTNYLLGYYSGPPATSADYQALRVATAVLTGRLFAEIRTRQNLTYDVHAPFLDRAVSAGGLYISTVSPDRSLQIMRAAIDELQRETLDVGGLERLAQQFVTEYFMDNETNAAQADFLARAQLYRGDYRLAERFMDEVLGVTPADVQRVARKYMKGFRFAYVGDPSRLNRSLINGF
ncbi:MAG: insulinase family protein [Gemmatimonadaceae bacterium]|nr:insulinase family protein [Gemmatimonadaceae bacterium]